MLLKRQSEESDTLQSKALDLHHFEDNYVEGCKCNSEKLMALQQTHSLTWEIRSACDENDWSDEKMTIYEAACRGGDYYNGIIHGKLRH